MAQSDQVIQNSTFPAVRSDINDNLAALFSQSSGPSAPAVTVPFQPWIDTSSSPAVWKIRNAANNNWVTVGLIDAATFQFSGVTSIANGGTGQTTATAAINALLPSQTGQSGKSLTTNGTNVSWGAGSAGSSGYAILQDQKADGVASGTFTSGAWRTRTLNTIVANSGAIVSSLSSNQFTLIAGTYLIIANCAAHDCNNHQIRLYNVSASTASAYGLSMYANENSGVTNNAYLSAEITIASPTIFRIEHRCATSKSTNGFGVSTNWTGNIEIYATVEIYKRA